MSNKTPLLLLLAALLLSLLAALPLVAKAAAAEPLGIPGQDTGHKPGQDTGQVNPKSTVYIPLVKACGPMGAWCESPEFLDPVELLNGGMAHYTVNYREMFLFCWHEYKFCQLYRAEELEDSWPPKPSMEIPCWSTCEPQNINPSVLQFGSLVSYTVDFRDMGLMSWHIADYAQLMWWDEVPEYPTPVPVIPMAYNPAKWSAMPWVWA